MIWSLTPLSVGPTHAYLRNRLAKIQTTSLTINSASELCGSYAFDAATALAPFCLVLVISGLAANLLQVGWLWAPWQVAPRFRGPALNLGSRLVDASGFILRLMTLALVTWRYLMVHSLQLHSLGLGEPATMLSQSTSMVSELCFQLSASLVLLGILDYSYRFWRHERSLMMTAEEVRQEQRENSVDPQIRSRRERILGRAVSSPGFSEIEPVNAAQG